MIEDTKYFTAQANKLNQKGEKPKTELILKKLAIMY